VRELHEVNAWLLIATNAAMGVWCLVAYRYSVLRGRAIWVGVVIAQLTTFVQAVVGAVLSKREGIELDDMHALYGFSAIVAVGIMYSYRTSPFMKGKELMLYGFGSLFLMGLGLRNLYLG
jgi:urea transporter